MVVKIGSSTLTSKRGTFRLSPVAGLVADICELHAQGHRILLVSSGAVSSGMGVLRFKRRPTEVVDLQAAAAVGQGRLFHIYTELFAHENVVTAQVLLTAFDVAARTQYLNARNTLNRLLDWKVVPIINENDTTATDELCFGDNDSLAAQVALLVKADLMVLLTDTDGLYTADPREDGTARLITRVDDPSELECVRIGAIGPLGSGGMGTKVNSARIATSGGVETIIARGTRPGVLKEGLEGAEVGPFRCMADRVCALAPGGKPLHTALRYGLSQALLDARARATGRLRCEVVCEEWGLPVLRLSLWW